VLKLGVDGASMGMPEVIAGDPVVLILGHVVVERLNIASMSSWERWGQHS